MLGLGDHEPREDFAVQAAQGRGGEDAFGGTAGAHDGVDAGAENGGGDAGGEIAVADEADARSGGANIVDELFVAGTIENDDDEVFLIAIEAARDGADVIDHRGVEIDGALTARPHGDFVHVQIGGVQQAALFAGGQDGDGVGRTGGAEVGALERIDGDIHGGIVVVGIFG